MAGDEVFATPFADTSSSDETVMVPSAVGVYGNMALRGMSVFPTAGGADTGRYLDFKDKLDDTLLFRGFIVEIVVTGSDNYLEILSVMLPAGGIRCPNGFKVDVKTEFVEGAIFFYSGDGS